MTSQPDEAYLQGKRTELATFSMARFLMEPRGPRQVGQQVSLGRQLEHTWEGTHKKKFIFAHSTNTLVTVVLKTVACRFSLNLNVVQWVIILVFKNHGNTSFRKWETVLFMTVNGIMTIKSTLIKPDLFNSETLLPHEEMLITLRV